eukprot:Gb_23983 [translate_table: standard]
MAVTHDRPLGLLFLISFFLCFWACQQSDIPQIYEDSYCGSQPICYPFGLDNKGFGLPDFQIECDHNHIPVLTYCNKKEFAILNFDYSQRKIHVVEYEKVFAEPCGPPSGPDAEPMNSLSCPSYGVEVRYDCNISHSSCTCQERPSCDINSFYYPYLFSALQKCSPSKPPEQSGDRNLVTLTGVFELELRVDEHMQEKCDRCLTTKGTCGYDPKSPSTPDQFLCHCRDRSHSKDCYDDVVAGEGGYKGKSHKGIIIGSIIGGIAFLMVIGSLLAVVWVKRRGRNYGNDFSFQNTRVGVAGNDHILCTRNVTCNCPVVFSYQELAEATNSFDKKRKLGDGGFGSVYLGKLRDGLSVAVKKLHEDKSTRIEQFVNEVEILSRVRHPYLVRLFGWCQNSRSLLLVYEYVPNGTLADHLHGERKGRGLAWKARLNIALGTAEALSFLHFGVEPPIFHRDVKPTNILLDECLRAKVADFGLSRLVLLKGSHISTAPQGTPGYLDPDYHRSFQLTDKSDVYSFGVVLVEIISAKIAVDITRERKEISLANLAVSKIRSGALHELVDPQLGFESDLLVKAMVKSVAELSLKCLAAEKDDRPCMMEVVSELEQIYQMGYGRPETIQTRLPSSRCTCSLVTGMQQVSPNSVQAKWSTSNSSSDAMV